MKKESILMAILAGFAVYLDIILKIVYSSVNELHAMGDFWWLIILITIFVLFIFCVSYHSLTLYIVAYVMSFVPIIVFIGYLIKLEPVYTDADWKLVVIYIVSELILLIPIYVLQLKKIIKTYRAEI